MFCLDTVWPYWRQAAVSDDEPDETPKKLGIGHPIQHGRGVADGPTLQNCRIVGMTSWPPASSADGGATVKGRMT